MGEITGIAWTRHSWSPWEGCEKVSKGCQHCYAEGLNHRFGHSNWGRDNHGARQPLLERSEKYWQQPIRWNAQAAKEGARRRVFPSMCDPFDSAAPSELFHRFITLIIATPHLDWLLLTKRPELVDTVLKRAGMDGLPDNTWLGTSAEDQPTYNQRVPTLLDTPARQYFLSLEPLLGPIDLHLDGWVDPMPYALLAQIEQTTGRRHGLWTILGGESGHGARRMDPEWVEDIIWQCQAQSVPVFMKQTGAVLAEELHLQHRSGADESEWPGEMRVQEFPVFDS